MAKQNSYLKIKGTLGGLSFYKSRSGHLIREKGGIDGKRMATDPAFERTRENNTEFGRATKGGQLVRAAFKSRLQLSKDKLLVSRLGKLMVRVVKSDPVSLRGARNVTMGDLSQLENFQFNDNALLGKTLNVTYIATIDRATGQMEVSLPAFVPSGKVSAPIGATHFTLIASGAELDFDGNHYVVDEAAAENLPLDHLPTAPIDLSVTVTPGSTQPLLLAFGIVFTQEVNGLYYPLKDTSFNAMALVKVSGS
ncbi:hypothetical protein [Chitinophaga defluvii]|uniref:DUF4469 domain-containing protein n=1 Tax=Chitinophaga defluvii TaxID=3163343 RepID=A0ABV2TAU6_9BACT